MGVTIETWVVKDPSKIGEHDQFFIRWMEYVVSTLGKSAPSHRYFAQRNPVGGRVFVIEFNSDEDEKKLDKMRMEDKAFAKFRYEWKAYAGDSLVIRPCDEIMQDVIKEIESKHR